MAALTAGEVLAATRQWLKPAVHILIRCGIPWREFAELAKSAYVEVATAEFGKRSRPTNVSRTAVLTGLTRREVRKQREKLQDAPQPLPGYVSKASVVLSAWHLHPPFRDATGKPALLALKGDGASFEALVRHCGGDIRPTTLLKELRSASAVRETADGRLEALKRVYVPDALDGELIRLWGTTLADVAGTYVHNLTRKGKTRARFERQAVSERVNAEAVPEFEAFLEREGQAFLERLDAWLAEHEVQQDDADTIRLGIGVYHVQD